METIKSLVVHVLNWTVRRYLVRNRVKVIAVAGSIGKTSTAHAIRTVLSQKYKLHRPKTAYNTTKSVHLEMFDLPFATSFAGWVKTVGLVLSKSFGKAPYEVLVLEIGTDHPGELQTFAWLQPELGVLTAIAPEHMEFFKTMQAVAQEELSISRFCKQLVLNAHRIDRAYVPDDIASQAFWYGTGSTCAASNYRLEHDHVQADFALDGQHLNSVELQVLGEHSLDALMAAAAVGLKLGLTAGEVAVGLKAVKPVSGRMQRLKGMNGTTLIDDSYNASPQACKAALDVLAQFKAPQRIAVLGMMNEMGDYSPQAHQEVGQYCDPSLIDMVLTIGTDDNEYLAPAAAAAGCRVERFDSPYAAGEYVKQYIKPQAVVLFKGSQNGVFAEEAVKAVLADSADISKLVRQSEYWMSQKRQQFSDAVG